MVANYSKGQAKNNARYGEGHPAHVLTVSRVIALRLRFLELMAVEPFGALERLYYENQDLYYNTMRNAILGITWKHVRENLQECQTVWEANRRHPFTDFKIDMEG